MNDLVWRARAIHPAVWLLVATTLIAGVSFAFFGFTESVMASALYQATNYTFVHTGSLNVWGAVATASALGAVYGLMTVRPSLTRLSATVAFMVWVYAAVLYVLGGFWLQLFWAAVPNIIFWTWVRINTSPRV